MSSSTIDRVSTKAQRAHDHVKQMSCEDRKAARVAAGKSQMAIAMELGVSLQAVRRWEQDKAKANPSEDHALKYLRALNIAVA